MKDRPIFFSGPMVRAILEDRKTHTRRVIKPQPAPPCAIHTDEDCKAVLVSAAKGPAVNWLWSTQIRSVNYDSHRFGPTCPYGQPGDRLWVRETWCVGKPYDKRSPSKLPKPTREEMLAVDYLADPVRAWSESDRGRWRPSIHMPRWASRITLEIQSVGVERLQKISNEDCWKEGMCDLTNPEVKCNRRWFSDLWDSINAKPNKCSGLDYGHPWASNPWVWVIEFARV